MNRRTICCAGLTALLLAAPALAQISVTTLSTNEVLPSGRNSLAFDGSVYLQLLWGSPVRGRFLSSNGDVIGSTVPIAAGSEGFSGWTTVTAGGPSNDPMFLVTYLSTFGTGHTEWGRVVRYNGGTPTVSAPFQLGWVGPGSLGAEKATGLWTGTDWIVGIRLPAVVDQPYVVRVQTNGTVSAPVPLGDGVNFQSWPTIDCATTDACLVAGYGDIGFTTFGVIYSRLFRKSDLAPLTNLFYLDDHAARADDPAVTFNKQLGKFVTGWFQANFAYLRTVDTSGNMGPVKTYQQAPGWGAGDLALRYNETSKTTLMAVKGYIAGLFIAELDDTLSLKADPVQIVSWDGKWQNYNPTIALDRTGSRWLVTSQQTAGLRGAMVQGVGGTGGGTPPPPPPPPPPPAVSISALNPSHILPTLVGTSVTWTATASGGASTLLYRFERWRPGTGWQTVRDYTSTASAVILTLAGNQAVRVSVKATGSSNDVDAQSNPVFFVGGASRALSLNVGGGGDVFAYNGITGGGYLLSGNLGTFTELNYGLGWGPGNSVITADFNCDGLTDLFVYNAATGQAMRAINGGDGTFNNALYTLYTWSAGLTVVGGDFNGDGRDDLFTYSKSSGAWTKQLTNANWDFVATSGAWSADWNLYTGDFNGDGITDLLVYNKNPFSARAGEWQRVINGANGGFAAYIQGTIRNWWTEWTVSPGDFDGDGKTDLLLYGPDGRWYKVFFPSNSGPERYSAGQWSLGWTPRVGDFNGDRVDDVFVYNQTSGAWYVCISTGDDWSYATTMQWAGGFVPTVTDINRDGLADLIMYNPSDGRWFQIISSAIPAMFGYYTGDPMETGLQMIAALSGR